LRVSAQLCVTPHNSPRFVSCDTDHSCLFSQYGVGYGGAAYGRASVDLRDFESIFIFLSEEEMEELQAAIDERRSRRLACDGEDCSGSVEQPVYSPNVGEGEFLDVRQYGVLGSSLACRVTRSPLGGKSTSIKLGGLGGGE
jgi:hypothetical protein